MLCTKTLTRGFSHKQSHPCKLTPFQQLLVGIQRWISSKLSITTLHNFRINPTETCSLLLSLGKHMELKGHKAGKTPPQLPTGLRQTSVATRPMAKLNFMALQGPFFINSECNRGYFLPSSIAA